MTIDKACDVSQEIFKYNYAIYDVAVLQVEICDKQSDILTHFTKKYGKLTKSVSHMEPSSKVVFTVTPPGLLVVIFKNVVQSLNSSLMQSKPNLEPATLHEEAYHCSQAGTSVLDL